MEWADLSIRYEPGQTREGIRYNPSVMLPVNTVDPERTVYYRGTDRVRTCVLTARARVQSIEFPAGSILGFNEDGQLWRCRLGADAEIHGLPCKGENEIEFYADGQLLSCFLFRPLAVSGCRLKQDTLALFHPSGELFRGILKDGLLRQGYALAPGSELCLFKDGRVSTFQISSGEVVIDGVSLALHSQVWFHPDGRLKAGTLASVSTLQGIECPAGSLVWFHGKDHLVKLCRRLTDNFPRRHYAAWAAEHVDVRKHPDLQQLVEQLENDGDS